MVVNDVEYISEMNKNAISRNSREIWTLSSKVERALRTAISITFDRGNIEEIIKYFDANTLNQIKRAKNSEFIATLWKK